MTEALRKNGTCINVKRVARLMRLDGLRSKLARKFKATTNSKHTLPVADNILNREFEAGRPNEKMVSDITYIRTREAGSICRPSWICVDSGSWAGLAESE